MEIWGAGQVDSASTRVSFGPVGGSATVVAEAGSVSTNVTASQQQSSGQGQGTVAASYSVKVVNPNNKGGFVVEDLGQIAKLTTVEDVRSVLEDKLQQFIDDNDIECGYVFPGHGMRGKHRNLENEDDLVTMYREYKTRKTITLWMKIISKSKRKRDSSTTREKSPNPKRSSYDAHLNVMSEVEEIVNKLERKHESKYTPEQYRAWAHMVQMHKHTSYDDPPDKPFFGKSRKKGGEVGVSPSKKIGLRSECIEQLDKWHRLKERGVISSEQYEEMQRTILADLKRF